MSDKLKCPGVGRNGDHDGSLIFYFSRRPTDDEMRYLHDVMKRAAECSPIVEPRDSPNVPEWRKLRVVGDTDEIDGA